jgi:hypothetical protein
MFSLPIWQAVCMSDSQSEIDQLTAELRAAEKEISQEVELATRCWLSLTEDSHDH